MNRTCILLLALTLCAGNALAAGDHKAGKKKAEACAACHGADGNTSLSVEYPRLAGQYASYIEKALADYKSGARKNPIMAGMVANLSEQDRADLAAYFASRPGNLAVLPR